jgi:hypothetical protein
MHTPIIYFKRILFWMCSKCIFKHSYFVLMENLFLYNLLRVIIFIFGSFIQSHVSKHNNSRLGIDFKSFG